MGGAEGTKLDLDFMDMERVSRFWSSLSLSSILLVYRGSGYISVYFCFYLKITKGFKEKIN